MKRSAKFDARIVAIAASLLLGLLAGLGQLLGFFGRVSAVTALGSLALAVAIALFFPDLLRRKIKGKSLLTPKQVAFTLAVLVALVGTAPYLVMFAIAMGGLSDGTRLLALNQNGRAVVPLRKSALYFEDIGLGERALRSKIALIQAEAGAGDLGHADSLIAAIERAGSLTTELQGKLYIARGILAYVRAQYEQAEQYYLLAAQSVAPRSRDQAILKHVQGILWGETNVADTARIAKNYRDAEAIFRALEDELGLAQIRLAKVNLIDNFAAIVAGYDSALVVAKRVDNPLLIGTIQLDKGKALREHSHFTEAQAAFDSARIAFERAADLFALAELELSEARLELSLAHKDAARQHLGRAASYFKALNLGRSEGADSRRLATVTLEQADVLDQLGESKESEKSYKAVLAGYATAPDPQAEATARIGLAALYLRTGRTEEARVELRRAREIAGIGRRGNSRGVIHNDVGFAYQQIGADSDARAEYVIARDIFESSHNVLLSAEALENIAIIDFMHSRDDSVPERVERALAIYDSLRNYDREAKTLLNLYQIYANAHDARAAARLSQMMLVLKSHEVEHETEANVLLNLYPRDLRRSDMVVMRERVRGLLGFYRERSEPVDQGRCLLQLARIEQELGNGRQAREYARQAAPFADSIPLPLRINFHSDLGSFLVDDDLGAGLDHFWQSFDLLPETDHELRLEALKTIAAKLPLTTGKVREAQRLKLKTVAQSNDQAIRALATRLLAMK